MDEQITLICSKCKTPQTLDKAFVQHMVDNDLNVFCPLGHPGVPEISKSSKKLAVKKAASKKAGKK